MSTGIDSLDTIRKLKNGDIIYRPDRPGQYVIAEIGEDFFIIELKGDKRFLKLVRFPELIKDRWHAVDGTD